MTSQKSFLTPINVIMLTVLIDMTGFGMIIPLIPFYAQQFRSGPTGIGFLLASFSLMQFIFSPVLGKISDTRGRRIVLIFSILTSIGSFILFTFATSYLLLLLSRIVAGLATEAAVAQAYVADVTSKEERSAGIGKVGAAIGVGFILGPVIGGILSPYGFKTPGAAALILSILNLGFVYFFLPEPERITSSSKETFFQSMKSLWLSGKDPLTGQVYLIYFIVTLAFASIPVIVPLLAIDYYRFSEVEMSYVFIFIGVIQVFLQGFAIKKLVKKLGEERLIIIGSLTMLGGIISTPILKSIPGFGFATILTALGVGISNTAVPGFLSLITSPEKQGSILGFTQSIGSIARIFGPILGGYIIELISIQASFYISGLILLAPFLLGCRLFQACTLQGLLDPPDKRKREEIELIRPS